MSISDQNIFANDANVPVARVVGTAFDPKPRFFLPPLRPISEGSA